MMKGLRMVENRKYEFNWGLLGDIQAGRPNLGHNTRLEVYRLMQFTFRDVLEQHYGAEEADKIFFEAGKLSGKQFFQNVIGTSTSFEDFINQVQTFLEELNMAIFRVEKSDPENGHFVLTMSEDLDCSGLPEMDYEICTYDEGFIAGLLESYSGTSFHVKEIDCWSTGDRTCRFVAKRMD
jgi:predicted hydrocarbon binding protein